MGNTDMYYVSFGAGEKNLVVLPGLSADAFTSGAAVKGRTGSSGICISRKVFPKSINLFVKKAV